MTVSVSRHHYTYCITTHYYEDEPKMPVTSMGTQLSVRLDEDLETHLEEYRSQQRFEPDKSDVVREALREFLKREADAGNYDPSIDFDD